MFLDDDGQIYAKGTGKYFFFSAEQAAAVAAVLTYQDDDLPIFREMHQVEAEGNDNLYHHRWTRGNHPADQRG